jgi:hypothetical protein
MNVGGGIPGETDRATFGTPAKFTYCAAENIAASPWEPLHVERGFAADTSTVTVVGAEAPHNVNDHGSISAEDVLTTIAETMSQPGSNNAYYDAEGPWVVLSPEHASIVARDGWSKQDAKRFLFDRSQVSISRFARGNVERFLLSRWPPQVRARARRWLDGVDTTDVKIPLCSTPEAISIIVAGGPGKHSLFIPTFGATRSVTLPMMLLNGKPANSIRDFSRA